jgi:hypothetical protein
MGFNDHWDDYSYWDEDDDTSSEGIKVLFVDPGNGINRHPAIEIQGFVFLMTSQRKRKGEPGYLEIPEGEGGLRYTSFLNLNQRFEYDSCTIICEWECLSSEIMDEIYVEVNRLHPDIAIQNQTEDMYDDDWDYGDGWGY